MKNLLSFIFLLLSTCVLEAQVLKTIDVSTSGTLTSLLTATEKSTITDLIITGKINAQDVKCIRDEMLYLNNLDISMVVIQSYSGFGGTDPFTSTNYYANVMPQYSFSKNAGSNWTENPKLKSIILPNTLISIGYAAFRACSGLTNMILPNTIKSIEGSAFAHCSGLTSITFGSGVSSIGTSVFFDCPRHIEFIVHPENTIYSSNNGVLFDKNQITLIQFPEGKQGSYEIPNSVSNINDLAFYCCKRVTDITIPSSVTKIGHQVFYYCSGLTNITLPNTIRTIGEEAFSYCSGLTFILIPNSVTSIGSGAFMNCSMITSFIIPNSVTSIGTTAFYNCQKLTNITIPSSVTSIGSGAFQDCKTLTSIYALKNTPVNLSLASNVFYYVNDATLYVPIGSKTSYQQAVQWRDFANIVEITITNDLQNKTTNTIKIYPNPFNDYFKISGLDSNGVLLLSDLNGKNLLTKQVNNEEKVYMSSLPKGLYLVKIITAEDVTELKVIKR